MFDSLPVELVRDVLEFAARSSAAHDLASVASLALTCRDVYKWIQPILYEVVCIDEHTQDAFFYLVTCKPPDFFRTVQHLMLLWAVPPGHLEQKFMDCFQHVRHLTTHVRGLRFLSRAPTFRPTRLFITSPPDQDIWASMSPTLEGLTHVHLAQIHGLYSVPWSEISTLLPSLSHIRLDTGASWGKKSDFSSLEASVSSMLQLPCCARVLVHYWVHSTPVWKNMVAALRTLEDSRVHVYRATRAERKLNENQSQFLRSCARNARGGVDPWQIGRAAYAPPTVDVVRHHLRDLHSS